MALRIWNQISSVKRINRQATSLDLSGAPGACLRRISDAASTHTEDIKPEGGRFVRTAPGPGNEEMLQLRPMVRRRVQHGVRHVQESARLAAATQLASRKFRIRDGSEFTADHDQMEQLRREYVRRQSVAALQPYHLVPFCSKTPQTFFREDIGRNRSFLIGRAPKRYMSTKSRESDEDSVGSEVSMDAVSLFSQDSKGSTKAMQLAPELEFDAVSEAASTHSQESLHSQHSVLSADSIVEAVDPNQKLSEIVSNPNSSQKSYVGHYYTKFFGRAYSTCSRPIILTTLQVRTMSSCKGKKPEMLKDCKDKVDPDPDEKPFKAEKGARWTKCECCPEMLDCDEIQDDIEEALFDCPPDNLPCGRGPPDCPPPVEPPPPRKVPLPRLCERKVYHCTEECTNGCDDIPVCQVVYPKTLPQIPKGNCMCREDPPMVGVPMVRLPPICMCPPPPDPKCVLDQCPPRADEVCQWKFPVKKLKNFWCPNTPLPKSKYKFCQCHTRTQPECKKGELGPVIKDD